MVFFVILCRHDEFCISEETTAAESEEAGGLHSHAYVEALFVLAGECELFIKEKMYRLHRNYMIIIPNGVKHRTISSAKCRKLFVALPLHYIHVFLAPAFNDLLFARALKLSLDETRFAKSVYQKICGECALNDKYSQDMLKSCVLEFFVTFSRNIENNRLFEKEATVIDEIIVFLTQHYAEEIGLKTVSQQFFVSRSYLSRLFKAKTGRGFNEYLNKIRIEQAKILLKTTALPITEIAFGCGFNDSNYFSKVFSRAEGTSPHLFRKGVGGHEETTD